MQIKIHAKHLTLSDYQQEYIETKISNVARTAPRGDDESSVVNVEVEYVQHKDPSETIGIKIKFTTPGNNFHTEGYGTTIEEVIDILEEKLRNQINHTK